jgi:hypothetical protein
MTHLYWHPPRPKDKMDPPNAKRNKKSDKAKRNFAINGAKSQKHVRVYEALLEKKVPPHKPPQERS